MSRWPSLAVRVVALAIAALSVRETARAQLDPEQADRALATFSPRELEALAPLLRTGTVSLVEFASPDQVPAVVIATEIDAPASVVAGVIADPRGYPGFMPALDQVTVTAEEGAQLSYSWMWQT